MKIKKEEIALDDIDYTDLESKYSTKPDLSIDHIMILDGIPTLEIEKEKPFLNVIKKKFIQEVKDKIREDGVYFPKDNNVGKGFMFIEFDTPDTMKQAISLTNNVPLDKNHKLFSYSLSELLDLSELKEPTEQVYVPESYKEREHLRGWLLDHSARDQFYTLYADNVSIWWNEKTLSPEQVFQKNDMAEYLAWSPHGTFLMTFHEQGIIIWGGSNMSKFQRFAHPRVAFADISPDENYLVTFSHNPLPNSDKNCIIWDMYTGRQLSCLSITMTASEKEQSSWPLLKWSCDEAYVAYIDSVNDNRLQILALPNFKPIEGKFLVNVSEFSWAPNNHTYFSLNTTHLLAIYIPESQNIPARISLVDIPSMNVIRSKNLFNVALCQFQWHNQCDYLIARVDRQRTKKLSCVGFELFRLHVKDVPIDAFEPKTPGATLLSYALEPYGDHFAYITNEDGKRMFYIYHIDKQLHRDLYEVNLVKQMERKNVSKIYWSPKGRFLVLAGLDHLQGTLEFWGFNDKSDIELLSTAEHYNATNLEWDPSGRYIISYQSYWTHQVDNTFIIWDFKGSNLRKQPVDKLKQVKWRPRPPTLLSQEKVKEIKKSLREYSSNFDVEDAEKMLKTLSIAQQRLFKLREEWNQWRKSCESEWQISAPKHKNQSNDTHQIVEEWIEELLEETEQIIE